MQIRAQKNPFRALIVKIDKGLRKHSLKTAAAKGISPAPFFGLIGQSWTPAQWKARCEERAAFVKAALGEQFPASGEKITQNGAVAL